MDNGLVLRVERLKPEDLGDHDIDYDFDGQFRHDLEEKTIRSRFLRTLGPLHDILRIEGGVVIGMSLPWDAEVLGVPTYRVLSIAGLPAHLTESILDDLMVERSMELGCCRARVGSLLHARLLDLTGWHLISTKVMFRKVLDERAARAESQKSWRSFQELSTRHRRKAIVQMWGLWEKRMPANRFTRDPRLGAEKARAVYREWITHATEDKGQMVWIWKRQVTWTAFSSRKISVLSEIAERPRSSWWPCVMVRRWANKLCLPQSRSCRGMGSN